INNDSDISFREIAKNSDVSKSSILNILHSHNFHSFHVSLHQELHGSNIYNHVIMFCQWILQK
ncbi:hypothetical protein X777_12802, partial [Ooceraea biroi]